MVSNGSDDNIAGLGRHESNALLPEELLYLVARMIVLIVVVRRANCEARLKM
ncbi:hypothetical protein NK6_4846 [Bradyrhizobium diazoefficiens]|uniref:Uncharacterized protein n=1 Tax=Bradyrhizobium diazoefficiens TaxID=1355477 RepID=A0A0E4BR11_9BRAD|nr:hypothetical protein NK6_4846 [Bradyrhizobium diazoefficiens]